MRTTSKTKHLRSSTEPFPLPLSGHKLSFTVLEERTGLKAKDDAGWLESEGNIISCREGTALLSLSLRREKAILTLTVSENELFISCSCGAQVSSLCPHAYSYLFRVSRFGSDSFVSYAAGGRLETALRYPALFTHTFRGCHLYIQPKGEFGSVYGWEEKGFLERFFATANNLPGEATSEAKEKKDKGVVYLLMSSPRNEYSPFLVPCPGTWNKEDTDIKYFGNYFLNGAVHEDKYLLGKDEAPRLAACAEIGKKSEETSGWANYNSGDKNFDTRLLVELHKVWAHSLHLFSEAPVFLYNYFGSRTFRHKPVRRYTHPVHLQEGKLSLSFLLQEKEHHYTLSLRVEAGGKWLREHELTASFFIGDKRGSKLYLLPGIRDAALLYWMQKNGGRVTVLKPHFHLFQQEILAPLLEHYTIKTKTPKQTRNRAQNSQSAQHKT